MDSNKVILIEDYCRYNSIEISFVKKLGEQGLIALEQSKGSYFINHDDTSLLEKYVHFHYELDINIEGIEAISHLLKKVERLQAELRALKEYTS